jgi:hypothetical protein
MIVFPRGSFVVGNGLNTRQSLLEKRLQLDVLLPAHQVKHASVLNTVGAVSTWCAGEIGATVGAHAGWCTGDKG